MARGAFTVVMAALGGMVMAALLVVPATAGQRLPKPAEAIPLATGGHALVQAPDGQGHDGSRPCEEPGTLPEPGCCASAHAGPAAVVMPRGAAAAVSCSGTRAEYAVPEARPAHGIRVSPALPPPRAVA